jgi:hypothetical protein
LPTPTPTTAPPQTGQAGKQAALKIPLKIAEGSIKKIHAILFGDNAATTIKTETKADVYEAIVIVPEGDGNKVDLFVDGDLEVADEDPRLINAIKVERRTVKVGTFSYQS